MQEHKIIPGRPSDEEWDRLVQGVDDIYFGGKKLDPDDRIGRFIQMQSEQNGISINEAAERSMARLFGQLEENPSTVVIMTAFRGERPLRQNRALNKQLASDIRQLGWGYTPVMGGFVEKTADGKPNRVHEESFFISANGAPKQVVSFVLWLLAKYEQEAALIKLPEQPDAMLLQQNGSMSSVGRWHADPQQMATYYTRMRSGPAGRQFTFEAAGDDSVMARMAVDRYFKNK